MIDSIAAVSCEILGKGRKTGTVAFVATSVTIDKNGRIPQGFRSAHPKHHFRCVSESVPVNFAFLAHLRGSGEACRMFQEEWARPLASLLVLVLAPWCAGAEPPNRLPVPPLPSP